MKNKELLLASAKKGINFVATHTLTVGYLLDDLIVASAEYGFCRKTDVKGNISETVGGISPNTFDSLYISDLNIGQSNYEGSTNYTLAAHIYSVNNQTMFSDNIGDLRIAFSPTLSFIGNFAVTVESTGAGNYVYTAENGSLEEGWEYLKSNNGKTVQVMIEKVGGGITSLIRCFFSQFFRKEVLV